MEVLFTDASGLALMQIQRRHSLLVSIRRLGIALLRLLAHVAIRRLRLRTRRAS